MMARHEITRLTFLSIMLQLSVAQNPDNTVFCQQQAKLSIQKTLYTIGETLDVVCNLPITCLHLQDNVLIQLGDVTLPHINVTLRSETYTVMARRTIQRADNDMWLSCTVTWDGDAPLADEPLAAASRLVRAGVPPSPVSNVTCVLYNYATMNCSYWPASQDTGIPTTHRIFFDRHSFNNPLESGPKWVPCRSQKGNTCVFEGDSLSRVGFYAILVQATNDLGEENKTFSFNVEYLVKLDRVTTLKLYNRGSTWLQLKWSKTFAHHYKENTTYQLTLTTQYTQLPRLQLNVTSDRDDLEYNVSGLVPHISYTITIRSFPHMNNRGQLEDAGFWSDPYSIQTQTLSTVAGVAQEVTYGGFRVNPKEELEFFWKRVPDYLTHGVVIHQRMLLFLRSPDDLVSCEGRVEVTLLLEPDISSTLQTLPGRGPYDVCLDLQNNVGVNEDLTLKAIRILQPGLRSPKFYARSAGNYGVEVRILEHTTAIQYTLYWCYSFTMTTCLHKDLHWHEVRSNESLYTLEEILSEGSVALGVSAEYVNSSDDNAMVSSGITYTSHIFKPGADIRRPTNLKMVEDQGHSDSLFLSWSKPHKADTVYINHFTLDYCLQDLCGDPGEHHLIAYDIQGDLDGSEQTVAVEGLGEDLTYEMRVRSDGDGVNSSYTTALVVVVPRTSLPRGLVIGLSVVGVFGVLLVVAGIYQLVRKCHKKYVEFRTPIIPIMPVIADEYAENGNTDKPYDPYSDIQHDTGYTGIAETAIDLTIDDQATPTTPDSHTDTPNTDTPPALPVEHDTLLDKAPQQGTNGYLRSNTEFGDSGMSDNRLLIK